MAKSRFRLIAFNAITPQFVDDDTIAHVKAMQKKIYNRGWLYFGDGYKLKDAEKYYNYEEGLGTFYGYSLSVDGSLEDYDRELYDTEDLCVTIDAIVGANGSGKSSTVDMILRLLNNLAVAAMGETKNTPAAEHLYFIEDVYGCLVFKEGGFFYQILAYGRSVKVGRYEYSEGEGNYICDNLLELLSEESRENRFEPIKQSSLAIMQLDHLFYTAIFNYSLYAFNYNDYYSERTIEDRWGKHSPEETEWDRLYKKEFTQDQVWLNGLFHKNDGYQTPIVLNPMREMGCINTNVENHLAVERILGKLLYENEKLVGHGGQPCFPFRIINEHLEIVALRINLKSNPKYSRENVLSTLGYKSGTGIYQRFDDVREAIVKRWSEIMQMPYSENSEEEKSAWDYVFYKTLKICKTYKHYRRLTYEAIYGKEYSKEKLQNNLFVLFKDESHVTLKLRRALYFLKYKLYDKRIDNVVNLYDIYKEYRKWLDIYQSFELRVEDGTLHCNLPSGWDKKDLPNISVEPGSGILSINLPSSKDKPLPLFYVGENEGTLTERLPDHEEVIIPPIFDIKMLLIEREKIAKDGTFDNKDLIPLEGLSSGEKQLIYSISNFTYQLCNINSVGENKNKIEISFGGENVKEEEKYPLIKYKYINAILDEVELYFHPDLQRRYVKCLVDALRNVNLNNIEGVNVLMITHSPFILSDIPHTNILFLDEKKTIGGRTFCGNIHEMLGDAFFMNSTFGAFAQEKLTEFIDLYYEDAEKRKEKFAKNRRRFKAISEIIADEYLRDEINDMYKEMESEYNGSL